jgi:L-amino acid N-acyltransferase YncA
MNGITTRLAIAADVAAITTIYAEQVNFGTATFEIVPPDEMEMGRRMVALVEAGYPYFVACEKDGVVGYGHAGPYRPRSAYRTTIEDSIYLAPIARGRGIGGTLLRLLIDECASRGFRQMIAVIGDVQNQASIRLHTAGGFAIAGTLKNVGYKHERWLDSVLMQRPIGDGDSPNPPRA